MASVRILYRLFRNRFLRSNKYYYPFVTTLLVVGFIWFISLLWRSSGKVGFLAGVSEKHKLAVIVPFRDRFEELLQFVPLMTAFLTHQGISFDIFIINQNDSYRFNRGSLINVGFDLTKNDHDYIAMHDVDLLPLNSELSYAYPEHGPFHIASPQLHPKYHYDKFLGGILLISRRHFEMVNGMSNKYWGWGMEDDEFQHRLSRNGINYTRPVRITTGKNTFYHVHGPKRKRDSIVTLDQRKSNRKPDHTGGLSTLRYVLQAKNHLVIDRSPCTIFHVSLSCDVEGTPWCLPSKIASPGNTASKPIS